ncbi:pantoate--beta-alanine ligase, partial [bacterium]|nr:pantoate--beta-alanine ligase [bacterium]
MKIIKTINELKNEIKNLKGTIGLVPTMGALHLGHKSLIDKSVLQNDNTVVSVFVNPIQFGKNEDLDKYPRTFEQDCELCEKAGVTIVFAPTPEVMYDDDKENLTLICPPYDVVNKLCGKSRPGHFDGVCSVVAKLFNLTHATRAYFGQKDAQQLFIIQKMVKDLNFDLEIVP